MSFVGGPFSHDLFVTYSHGDAVGDGDSPLKQWSQAFAEELARELRTLPGMGAALSMFLDESHRRGQSIDPLEPLTDQLQQAIRASALVTVLLSPQYLASSWCADERNWWRDAQPDLKIPHSGRIALVRMWPLPADAALPELFLDGQGAAFTGFWFFDRALEPTRCRPFEWPAATKASAGPFRNTLVELAGHLYEKLQGLKARLEERSRTATDVARLAGKVDGREQSVYLHGRPDQVKAWEETNDQLSSSGFTVWPTEPDPVEQTPDKAQEIRRRRVATLAECDALLLLGSADGGAVDADLLAIGRNERQLARARSNRLLPCALLDTVGPAIATDRRRLAARKVQVDWIDRKVEPWVPSVKGWLAQKSQELAEGQ